ncbi:class I SAM-dependent methyltransferase [Smaragdicoccus niigatensis]|uniref:class I SAM-dependent methyltransferase n=1 Tax=Smaragdicoccus niigatensis TaxID=359359 RepID=UPI000373E129|nr:class I SAM-dependent methyltransferase [Smaragdicoccus niigatensis]
MNIGGQIFAHFYDRIFERTERAGLTDMRRELLSYATGDVLEIGAGTGLNLSLYPKAIETLTLAEPEGPMLKQLSRKVDGSVLQVVEAPAEELPFSVETFDTVVSTLVLCTVNDPARALSEIRRVLRPGGNLLFLEHVRGEGSIVKWQDRLNGINQVVGHGCNCNRDTLASIRAAGFTVLRVSNDKLPKAPAHLRPLIWGIAQA